jgi:plasmid stability protein
MDTIIRNLDDQAYKALRARAVLEGRTVGEVINDAIHGYLARPTPGKGSLRALEPILLPPGNENLSSEIDQIVYGASRRSFLIPAF